MGDISDSTPLTRQRSPVGDISDSTQTNSFAISQANITTHDNTLQAARVAALEQHVTT